MARCWWACWVLLLAGCGALDDRRALFGGSSGETVGSFRATDYAVGETYRIRRDLLARRMPGAPWSSQYYLSGNDATGEIPDGKSVFALSPPELAAIPLGTRVKVTKVEPATSAEPSAFPKIYAEVLDGNMKGKKVLLSTISRERRYIDPDFVELATTTPAVATATNSLRR